MNDPEWVSYQGCALFGPSMVICIKAANGHRVIRDIYKNLCLQSPGTIIVLDEGKLMQLSAMYPICTL